MGRVEYERALHGGLGMRWSDGRFWWEEDAVCTDQYVAWLEAMSRGERSPPPAEGRIYLLPGGARAKYEYVLQLEHNWDGIEYVTAERDISPIEFGQLAASLKAILHPEVDE